LNFSFAAEAGLQKFKLPARYLPLAPVGQLFVAAYVLLTQAADFDYPGKKKLKSLCQADIPTDRVGQLKSAAWGKSVSAPTLCRAVKNYQWLRQRVHEWGQPGTTCGAG
jgi:hypothetical protein